jgi:hypothetical protein
MRLRARLLIGLQRFVSAQPFQLAAQKSEQFRFSSEVGTFVEQ